MATVFFERQRQIWRKAGDRYRKCKQQREDRANHMGRDGDWRRVEEEDRIKFRLRRKGMPAAMTERMVSDAVAEPMLGNVLLERIIAESQLMGASFLITGADIARSVCRVVIRSSALRVLGYGTGFLVSPRLLMTNNHVLGSKNEAANSIVQFDYYERNGNAPIETTEFGFEPSTFFRTSEALDFTLVALASASEAGTSLADRGWNPLIRESGKVLLGEPVNIIQHPRGEPLQVAIRENTIVDRLDDFLHYKTDTDRGSSGSPVCNDGWDIAALHHSGVPKTDDAGRILLRDGQVWDGSRDTVDRIEWVANEGVRISRIVKHLDTIGLTESEKILYQQCFSPPPEVPGRVEAGPATIGGEAGLVQQSEPDGSVSWYFRLNFGPVNSRLASRTALPKAAAPTRPAPDTLAAAGPRTGDDAALSKARELLERARPDVPYFEPEKDKEDRTTYYQDIEFNADGAKIFEDLSALLVETHEKHLSYKAARFLHLYPWVDLQETGKLRNIYSGTLLEPLEVIAAELDRFESQRPGFLAEMDILGLEDEEDDDPLDLALEAGEPFNCEHVVPQSWFDKKQPMKADLHHLFTCEPSCNSFRSNIPYFDFDPLLEVERRECGRREDDKFEPEFNHGVVARATLYFLLRYPKKIGDEARELQKARLGVLIDWHKRDPVDRYELHRNAAIFAAQSNRNPLIDFPELVEKIDFTKGFG